MTAATGGDGSARSVAGAWDSVRPYLARFFSATPRQQGRLARRMPLADLQEVALRHPDPVVRRDCVYFLDHHANEASTAVFATALRDPVESVRHAALHSIACESCRAGDLCAAEVVPAISGLLERDPNPELRTKAIPALLRLGGRDRRAWEAIGRAARTDPDPIVRQAAADALRGRFVAPRKRIDRVQRRHDRPAPRS